MERRALLRSLSLSKALFLHPKNNTNIIRSASASISTLTNPSLLTRPLYLSPQSLTISPKLASPVAGCWFASLISSSRRYFSADVSHLPVITDLDVKNAFKDLMAASWDELPDAVLHDAKAALSKATEDKAGQEALANVFRSAEAAEKFAGVLVSLRMELDDSIGLSGEKVGHMPSDLQDALQAAYNRYVTYLDAFGPDETYLRKKVEMELGTKMIHLKMRCSGLGSEWGKVSVLGTSGLSGSYVEHRA
eukprot:TRINITY_DN11705_c0_g3_i1.p1 TRINITY_DN11705_c0_g3~~TRINITY_DN11705_c0_g3_i1.p1  ORF type:complete len:249 (-),score=56.95 TRINITY_DN11705_c0_g3_i1:575-1321(-)